MRPSRRSTGSHRRRRLQAALIEARARTDALFERVRPEALHERPIPERHRLIFYLGHLEAFDANLMAGGTRHAALDRLFAFGIDPTDGTLPTDGPGDWPCEREVRAYGRAARRRVDRAAGSDGIQDTVLHEIPAGIATLGQSRGGVEPFGWDNEFDAHPVDVPSFAIDAHDRHPRSWVEGEQGWHYSGTFSTVPLPLGWPVYVSHAEASAYARFAGARLPTEAEWHRAACAGADGRERCFPWGDAPPSSRHGNFGLARCDPVPVGSHREGASAWGVHDLIGNGWEWTATVFAPFAGFERFPFYPGYSADFFFDGDPSSLHYVMKGASARTALPLVRRSFRNWFQPHYPYAFATFRLVE